MNALKRLVALRKNDNNVEQNETESEDENLSPITYFQDGAKKCVDASGSPHILKNCLAEVYQRFKWDSQIKLHEQEKLKRPKIDEQERLRSELSKRTLIKEIKENSIDELSAEIKEIENNIAEAPQNPSKLGIDADKKPRAQFYIGLLILAPITLYLLVFYISASYSAFFKEFSPTTTVFAAIFDGQALTKAYNDQNGGLLEVVFICTIPFAFMGLGYLVHMFQKAAKKPIFKIASLFVITFIFDAILAYQIENKIFDFDKLPGEKFNIALAFSSVEFWGIIFAGFVVYVIWGLVFDFIMKEYENIDKVKMYVKSQKNKRDNLISERKEIEKLKATVEEEIVSIEGKINELQSIIDSWIFEKKRYLRYHTEFLNGWLLAISKEIALPREQNQKLIEECNNISEEHLKKYSVDRDDTERVIYS